MDSASLALLNQRFALNGQLRFEAGPGGLPAVYIANVHTQAALVLQGAHVLSYQPRGQEPVLWASSFGHFAPGRPIRGGIPVCWPWFGAHPADPAKPGHGFVRTALWEVLSTRSEADGSTRIELGLADSPATHALWPHFFALRLAAVVGPQLQVELRIHNTGPEAFTCSGALHSYFSVSEAASIAICGLEGCAYTDKLDGQRQLQDGPVRIAAETDRVYLDTAAECRILDPGLKRAIRLAKAGSRTTVVWNPWIAKAARLEDFGDHEYRRMVCVETANAPPDLIALSPGAEHCLQTSIRVEPI